MSIPIMVEFIGTLAGLKGTIDEADAELTKLSRSGASTMTKLSAVSTAAIAGIGIAAVGVGAASVTMAAEFQKSMEMIHTQAGASQAEVDKLSKAVLNLAPSVGTGPDELATALYHIESTLSSSLTPAQRYATAMSQLKVAAEGAKVGNANLEDVTNALNAAVSSGIPGVQNIDQAMGALNATVGAGDMHMQDLADAMGSGMVTIVKGFGLSLNDVGAALATYGDNNIRGADAATDLRTAVQAMAKPAKGGEAALKALGLSSTQLATDMQQGGLNQALTDLHSHLVKTGNDGVKAGALLTDAFGKKSSAGLQVLVEQFGRFESKTKEVADGANNFGSAWKATTKTFAFQMDQVKTAVESLAIKLGTLLIPYVEKAAQALADGAKWLEKHKEVAEALGVAIGTVLAAAFVIATAKALEFTASLLTNPIFLVVAAVGALGAGLFEAYKHSETFRNAVQRLWADAKHVFSELRQAWYAMKDAFDGKLEFPISQYSGIGKVLAEIGTAARKASDVFRHDILPALEKVGDFIEAHLKPILIAVGISIGLIVSPVAVVIAGLVYLYAKFEVMRDIVADVIRFFEALPHAFENTEHAASNIAHAISNIANAAKDTWNAVDHAFTNIEHAGQNVWHVVGDVITWFANGPVKFVEGIVADFTKFWDQHGAEIEGIAKAVWSVISAVISVAMTGISLVIKLSLDVIETAFKVTWAAVQLAFTVFADAFSLAWKLLFDALKLAWDVATTVIKVAWAAIVLIFKTAWDVIATVFSTAIKLFLDALGLFLDLVTGHWSKLWKDAKKIVTDAWGGITKLFSDFAKNALKFLEQAGKDLIQGLINGLIIIGGALGDAWRGVLKLFLDFAKGAIKFLEQAGKDLIQGLINGIKSMGSAALDAAKGVVSGIKSGVESFFGMHSPSLVAHGWGENIVAGLVNGINANAKQATAAALSLSRGVTAAVSGDANMNLLVGASNATAMSQLLAMNVNTSSDAASLSHYSASRIEAAKRQAQHDETNERLAHLESIMAGLPKALQTMNRKA